MSAPLRVDASSLFVREETVPIGFLTEIFAAETEEEVCQTYARWCRHLTGSPYCSIGLPVGTSEIEITTVSAELDRGDTRVFAIDGTIIGHCFQTRAPVVLDDLTNQPYKRCIELARQGMKSMHIVPIIAKGTCFGVLVAAYPVAVAHAQKRFKTLEVIAKFLSTHMLLIRKMDQLGTLARTDPLTGAANRNQFDSLSDQFWADWTQRGRSFSLASIDIDHFKKINDTLGHAIGDLVLQEIVTRLEGSMRQSDHIVRMGGEEFCVLLDGASEQVVGKLADRLHNAIRVTPFGTPGGLIPVTASIGVAFVHGGDTDLSGVLARSDKALYKAKKTGRDRVVVAC